jgi:hypothetical protein
MFLLPSRAIALAVALLAAFPTAVSATKARDVRS